MNAATVAVRKEQGVAVARPVKVLVPLIKEELEAGDTAGVEHYRRAGELLHEAKEQIAHGDWKDWLSRHFHKSATQANAYMKLATASKKTPSTTFSSLNAAIRSMNPHSNIGAQAGWTEPVKQALGKIDYAALRQDNLNRAEARELERKLALQLIDIGFKVLAQKLHPDKKGGSQESFVRLKSVRDRLKNAV